MSPDTDQIIAPASRGRKDALVLYVAVCLGFAAWCTYDGYFNQDFITGHTGPDGRPDLTLLFNRYASGGLLVGAAALGIRLLQVSIRRLTATADTLIIDKRLKIPYRSIQMIDKTHFQDRGYFTITYGTSQTDLRTVRFSQRDYDNLGSILERLVGSME